MGSFFCYYHYFDHRWCSKRLLIRLSAGYYFWKFSVNPPADFFVSGTAAILYGGLLDLQYFGYLRILNNEIPTASEPYLYSVFVHVVAFLLTGLLSGTLAGRWRSSEEELQRKSIDYQELERLNRTILSHISSGLMIINRRGRMRSFNAAAVEITGYQLEDVYDRDVRDVFPNLPVINDEGYCLVTRAETITENSLQQKIVLGYATTLIKDHQENNVGLLITFQDLSQLKEVEEQLKRNDRLAAVGRMASGMAHEIRNPLASISGSLQLLLEGTKLSDEDSRLMSIVLREADRLSKLLSDFLIFARPRPPERTEINISLLFAECQDLLAGDERFRGIALEIESPQDAVLVADVNMLRQAIWNLFLNATDAMDRSGTLKILFDKHLKCLTVEDDGPGIDLDIRHRVFDPFFSTKEKGTGLGLATVFSIVDAHGGHIELNEGQSGGAAFHLYF